MAGLGFGAGFVEGASRANQEANQRAQIDALNSFRTQELGLKAQQFMLDQMRLSHQDAGDFYKAQVEQHNALMSAIQKGMENGKTEQWMQNPEQWHAILSNVATSEALLAGARANYFGGDHAGHLNAVANADQGLLSSATSVTDKAFANALAERVGIKTKLDQGTPTLEGLAKGQSSLAEAQGGGATAAGMTRAAQEAVTPRVMSPEQSLVVPPPGSLPGSAAPGAVASPMQRVVAPQPTAVGAGGGGVMPAVPVAPVTSAPLPAQRPGTLVPSQMAPGTFKAEEALGANFGSENEQKGYRGAIGGLQNLYQIMASADQLNKQGGFTNTGAGNEFKLNVAKQVNGWAQTFGLQPPFDANAVGSWEDMTKNTKLMGMQVINSYFGGSREAQSIVNAGISAVPGASNTPLGIRLVGSGVEQALQRQIELHDFIAQRIATNQPISNAESVFNKEHPAGDYAMRGIANAVPEQYVAALKADPSIAPGIDARFGKGIAQFILEGKRTGIGAAGGFPGQL